MKDLVIFDSKFGNIQKIILALKDFMKYLETTSKSIEQTSSLKYNLNI
jgi:hypothetical protein